MTSIDTEEDAQRWLRQTLMGSAAAMPAADADDTVNSVRDGFGIGAFTTLAKVVQAVHPVAPSTMLLWMQTTLDLFRSHAGREVLFMIGMRVAQMMGISAEVLEKLRAHVVPPTSERGH